MTVEGSEMRSEVAFGGAERGHSHGLPHTTALHVCTKVGIRAAWGKHGGGGGLIVLVEVRIMLQSCKIQYSVVGP